MYIKLFKPFSTRGAYLHLISHISAISAYHHYSCEFEPRSWLEVLDTTLCNKVCQ
jgi:hypothetical protein